MQCLIGKFHSQVSGSFCSTAHPIRVSPRLTLRSALATCASFRRQTTSAIRYDATSEELEAALEALSSIGSVSVLPEGSSICTSHEKSPFIVRFLSEVRQRALRKYMRPVTTHIGCSFRPPVTAWRPAAFECHCFASKGWEYYHI